jgi:hypothetical protein
MIKATEIVAGKLDRSRWEDNIKMDFREIWHVELI